MSDRGVVDTFKGAEQTDGLLPVLQRQVVDESRDAADDPARAYGEEEGVRAMLEHGVFQWIVLSLLFRTQRRDPVGIPTIQPVRQVNELLQPAAVFDRADHKV